MTEFIPPQNIEIMIPECCREGWDNCPHVVKKQKPPRSNIAL